MLRVSSLSLLKLAALSWSSGGEGEAGAIVHEFGTSCCGPRLAKLPRGAGLSPEV